MTTRTIAEMMAPADIAIPAHLAADAEIPVISGPQAQGDVLVLPAQYAGPTTRVAPTLVPKAGIEVIRAEAGGHAHLLVADGPSVMFDARATDGSDLCIGVLDVPEGSTAYLLHVEHGASGIGSGLYSLRRQREMGAAGERRMAD